MSPVDGERMATPDDPNEILSSDGRQSARASHIARGVGRLLASLGLANVCELTLPNGRRADVMGLSDKGDLWIIEVKSSIEDFRCDQKWPDYWQCCDRLFFAVAPDFPQEILPLEAGIIVADRYGGEIVRTPAEARLPPHRRRAITLRFAMVAAARTQAINDPGLGLDLILRGD